MAGLEIVQGEDTYPVDVGYPAPIDYGYPVELEAVNYPVIPDSSIEPSINPVQLETIKPQYRNGRNLWQEIVFQFSELLRLIK